MLYSQVVQDRQATDEAQNRKRVEINAEIFVTSNKSIDSKDSIETINKDSAKTIQTKIILES